jgi:hypothetical protein
MRAPSPPPTTQPVQRSVELAGGSTSEVTLHSGSELVQHTTLEAAIDMRAAVDEVLALLSGASAAAGGERGGCPHNPVRIGERLCVLADTSQCLSYACQCASVSIYTCAYLFIRRHACSPSFPLSLPLLQMRP